VIVQEVIFLENSVKKKKKVPELHLNGQNGFGWTTKKNSLITIEDTVTIEFKTYASDGLLYFNGYQADFVVIFLKKGIVRLFVHSKYGEFNTTIKPVNDVFNDNSWHILKLRRQNFAREDGQIESQITLIIDDKYNERWKTIRKDRFLRTEKVFFGGFKMANEYPILGGIPNFFGCLKQIFIKAESIELNFLELMHIENPKIFKFGQFKNKCQDVLVSLSLPFVDYNTKKFLKKDGSGTRDSRIISMTGDDSYLVR